MIRTLLAVISVLGGCPVASAQGETDQDHVARTNVLFAAWDRPDTPGCAVAVMQRGDIVYSAGFGRANLEHPVPNTPSTIFHIASVSKQFVAFAVCLLAADGELTLDDDVREYVPELPDFGTTITLRQLIHHTSGIRDQWALLTLAGWRMEDVITRDDVMELLADQRELNFEPGSESLYSNSGYTVLGLLVERVSGRTLDGFCQERVFEPLGMHDTHFHDDHRHLVPGRAESYWRDGDGYQKAVLAYAVAGATSLFTTVEDLMRWEENFFAGTVGGEAVLAMMEQQVTLPGEETPLSYGMAISHGSHRSLPTRGHGGADAGFNSFLLRLPEQHLSVAILTNTPMPVGPLARQVADIWLDLDEDEPGPETTGPQEEPVVQLEPAQLERLAGYYASEMPPVAIVITIGENTLEVTVGGEHQATLRPLSPTRFRIEGQLEGTVEFTETDGVVSRMSISLPGMAFELEPTVPEETIDAGVYVGLYESPELQVRYEILANDDGLALARRKHEVAPLLRLGPDRFSGPFAIVFERDDEDRVTGFRLETARVRGLLFERVH